MIYIIFLCVYYEKNHLSIPSLGLATAAALIATTSFSCWLQSLKWFFLILGEIIATQRRATPTQRHAKHGSTLKEKLAFLSGTMDFHKPNGSEQIQFFPNIPENIFGNDQREFHQYRMKKNYFRSRRCV